MSASADTRDSRTALVLHFNRPLAAAQTFDQRLAVTGPDGEVVEGSWSLDDDARTLRFPFVQPDTRYTVAVRAALMATDGHTLGHDARREVYSGNLPGAVQSAVVRALGSHQKLATILLKADKQAMTAFTDLIYELDRDRRNLDLDDASA